MGMFDSLQCKYPLPMTEEMLGMDVDWYDEIYQTKSLDCLLTQYKITEDLELLEEVVEQEYVPYSEEELKVLKPKPWTPFKEIVVKSRYHKPVHHHGSVVFYTSVPYSEEQDMWVEFSAHFIYGRLDKIELDEVYLNKSSKLYNAEFQAKREQLEKTPWNRLKRFLRPLGWRWAWLKVVDILSGVIRVSSKMQNLIYRVML